MGFFKDLVENANEKIAKGKRETMTTEELEEAYNRCKDNGYADKASERLREELWKRGIYHSRDRRD